MASAANEVPLRQLLSHRGYWRWSFATQLIRLPSFMAPMAYVLVSIDLMGRPGPGALVLAVMLVAGEVSAPFTGRFIDKLGIARWAPRSLMFSACGRLAIAGLFVLRAPTWLLVAVVIVLSCAGSGAGGIVRVMLGRTVPDELLPKALAIDSSMVELVIIIAPFLVTLAAFGGGVVPLIVMAACTAIGAVLLWDRGGTATAPAAAAETGAGEESTAAAPPVVASAAASRGLWRNPEYVFWLLVAIAFGHMLGTAETGALPLVRHLGADNAIASTLIAVLAGASATAGLVYAWRGDRIRVNNNVQAVILVALMAASCALFAFTHGWITIVAGFLFLGLWTAPINTVRSHAAGHVIPSDRQVEGFAILDTANGVGYAFAAALLAVVPVGGMLAASVVTGVATIVLAPVLLGAGRARSRARRSADALSGPVTSADDESADPRVHDVLTATQQAK